MKILLVIVSLVFLESHSPAYAEILITETFKGQQVGEAPKGAALVMPALPSDVLAVTIVSGAENSAGGGKGNGVRILDNSIKYAALDYNFVGNPKEQQSAIMVSFDLAYRANPDPSAERENLYFGVGAFGGSKTALNSHARRLVTGYFYNDGKCFFRVGENSKSNEYAYAASGKSCKFVIYLNDYDERTIETLSPSGTPLQLTPNIMVVFVDGKQLCRMVVEKFAHAENQMGRIGFSTGSTAAGIDFTIANLRVESLE